MSHASWLVTLSLLFFDLTGKAVFEVKSQSTGRTAIYRTTYPLTKVTSQVTQITTPPTDGNSADKTEPENGGLDKTLIIALVVAGIIIAGLLIVIILLVCRNIKSKTKDQNHPQNVNRKRFSQDETDYEVLPDTRDVEDVHEDVQDAPVLPPTGDRPSLSKTRSLDFEADSGFASNSRSCLIMSRSSPAVGPPEVAGRPVSSSSTTETTSETLEQDGAESQTIPTEKANHSAESNGELLGAASGEPKPKGDPLYALVDMDKKKKNRDKKRVSSDGGISNEGMVNDEEDEEAIRPPSIVSDQV